jgi:hypothetical protein
MGTELRFFFGNFSAIRISTYGHRILQSKRFNRTPILYGIRYF